MRCSYSIYLSRKNEIWRPWEAQRSQVKARNISHQTDTSLVSSNNDTEAFCGFEEREIQEISKENHRRLNIICKGLTDSYTFKGF